LEGEEMTIKKKLIEVVTITGPMSERDKAEAYIRKRELIPMTAGFIRMKDYIDTTRFRMVARKQFSYRPGKKGVRMKWIVP
jgi:hypothetical protein